MAGVVAAGFFDGVHLGHRRILEGADAALTFTNHPSSVLRPEAAPRLLMPFAEKERAIRSCGVKDVIALEFTPALAAEPPESFLRYLEPFSKIRCGADWRFGRAAAGDAAMLRAHGFEVEVVDYAELGGERISSTRIRAALLKGDLELAGSMLGRRWSVIGDVVTGKGLGAKIGYPTVNLALAAAIPEIPGGVYEVFVAGVKAIANWGYAPTMGGNAWKTKTLELHFKGDVPADVTRVEFSRFIRPEKKFSSIDELLSQIASDCRNVFGADTQKEI